MAVGIWSDSQSIAGTQFFSLVWYGGNSSYFVALTPQDNGAASVQFFIPGSFFNPEVRHFTTIQEAKDAGEAWCRSHMRPPPTPSTLT